MDCLSDVLSTVHFKGTIFCQADFTSPWGLQVGPYPTHTGFLMMIRGGCRLEILGQEPIFMGPGDLVLTHMSNSYTIQDQESSAVIGLQEAMEKSACLPEDAAKPRGKYLKLGGGGAPTSMVMGCFEFDTNINNPMINALPPLLYVRAENLQSEPWLDTTFRFLAAEAASERQGSAIVISRLTDLLFIQALRAHMSQVKNCPNSSGWLKAVADPQIGKALSLIHENPESPWTVASLADAVSMSRSSFAARFQDLLQTSPLSYVTSWRMQKAQEMLRQGADNLADVAGKIGYQSEAAFRKAFKRETGQAPGSFRRSRAMELV
ncbi:MAG: AraC family transcriptional regulator [Cyanobacteria bacterium REEB67]|nr:AraC family transcriptional regulator [Cyanobacteria bacterium REEB67]